jgi:hypothetical protein
MTALLLFQYVDPGTGSLLAQLFLSFAIGIGFYLLTIRRRLGKFFSRDGNKPNMNAENTRAEDNQ